MNEQVFCGLQGRPNVGKQLHPYQRGLNQLIQASLIMIFYLFRASSQ